MKTAKNYSFSIQELSDKDINNHRILELITDRGIISRTEISKAIDVNIVSVSNYIKKHIADNIIKEKGFDVSTGGRKPELVELNKADNRVLGVRIGRDSIHVLLADIGVNIVDKAERPRNNAKDKEAIETACGLIDEVMKRPGRPSGAVKGIGVGTSISDYASVGKEIEDRTGIETFAADEASCAAFGERRMNKNIPSGDILYVYSDIGDGVVVKDNGIRISGACSEYLRPWNEALGILNLAKSEVSKGVGTAIVEFVHGRAEDITADVVIEAAAKGDEVALSIIRSVGMTLGLRIAYLVNLFGPKSVVIGGGFEHAGALILAPIERIVKKLSLKNLSSSTAIMPGTLGDEAAVLGAAYLAAREIFLKA